MDHRQYAGSNVISLFPLLSPALEDAGIANLADDAMSHAAEKHAIGTHKAYERRSKAAGKYGPNHWQQRRLVSLRERQDGRGDCAKRTRRRSALRAGSSGDGSVSGAALQLKSQQLSFEARPWRSEDAPHYMIEDRGE